MDANIEKDGGSGWETSTAALVYRLFRYAVSTFVMIGIYPKVFKLCKNRF